MSTARRAPARVLSVLLALAVPATALVPALASGEPKPKPAKPADKKEKGESYDPENVTGISKFMATIAKGNERFAAKELTAAIDTYKKAIELAPKNALGPYVLAEAYLASGNMGEAEAAIQQAYELETKDPVVRSHVLFVRADVLERQKKWEEAKAAWQAYTEHAARLGDAGAHPQTGAERVKTVQRILELEKAYAPVRERIAAEKADAGKAAPQKK